MPRSRQSWGQLREGVIYPMLRSSSEGGWPPASLLALWNTQMDVRVSEMLLASEGWFKETWSADIVTGKQEYELPIGFENIDRVSFVPEPGASGANRYEIPLARDERRNRPLYHGSNPAGFRFRLSGRSIILEPEPQRDYTAGLEFDGKALPEWLSNDDDTLDARMPIIAETLLCYDTVFAAYAIEDSQGNVEAGAQDHVLTLRRELERTWKQSIELRTFGRVVGDKLDLGG